jgi:hypothetical protein
LQPLLFLKNPASQRSSQLREKHAQCVKKFGFFTRFFNVQKGRRLFFEGILHFQPCFSRAVAASLPWHEFGYGKS